MNTDNIRSTATEELKLLSSIIGRIESAIYQKQGWLFTLITGLTLALLKDDPLLCKGQFAIISVSITIIFFVADIVQRVPIHRAIIRSKAIEGYLSGKQSDYDGPAISESLGQGEGIKDAFSCFWRIRVWAPYVGILIMIAIIYVYAP
jgi:hypothetical protein